MLIGGIISSGLLSFLINLDGIIYNLIRHAYKIFVELAKVNIFGSNDEIFQEMIKRIYMVLGVVMLFVLAYSLLKAVINPDDFSKGDNSVPNIIKNILVSLVIIVILPTVFEVAFNIQNVIINSDIIGKVILNENADVTTKDLAAAGGNTIAYNTYKAFFHPDPTYCINEGYDEADETSFDECAKSIKSNSSIFNWEPADDLHSAYQSVIGGVTFRTFVSFSDAADNGEIEYNYLISTVVGVFLLFMIVSYCLDLGIRVVKLVFLQVIAPIPVICRIIPDKKKAFETWMKETVSTYIEVFIRIAIMYFGVFLITVISDKFDRNTIEGIDGLPFVQKYLILAFIIIGIVLFIKQAPKLIKDIFGIELGGSGLIPISTMLGLGAMAGAGSLQTVRNFAKGIKNDKGLIRSTGSALAGGVSAAARAGYAARNSKNLIDMKNSASTGLKGASTARSNRATYRAKHGNTTTGVMKGHFSDFKEWLVGSGVEGYDFVINAAADIDKSNTDFRNAIKKQIDKHSTDATIVYNMKASDFKGESAKEIFELYQEYKNSSLSAIYQDIEQRKHNSSSLDYNSMAKSSLALKQPDEKDFDINTDQGRIDFNNAFKEYNQKVEREANRLRMEEARKITLLNSMYFQLEKATITNIGEHAMNGTAIGSINSSDLFDAREKGKTLNAKIESSGLKPYDPAKDEKVEIKDGKIAKYFDDVAAAFNNQSTQAYNEKQKYMEKNNK